MGKVLIATFATTLSVVVFASTGGGEEEIKLGDRRIVGGEKTDIKEHPWQVALHIKLGAKTYLCGGSIIGAKWVLTAAHCFDPDTAAGAIRAKAGATDYMAEGSWLDAEKIVIHEKYDDHSHENDLALVKLRSFPKGRVIPLADANISIPTGQPLVVTGWGATAENGRTAHILLKVSVPYVSNDTCNEPSSYNGHIRPSMMCAGEKEGGHDACQGDSGGPLVYETADGPVLVGVVSFGLGCARKLKYGVYSRVSSFADWINKTMAAN